jgi:hypothetical protein
MMASAASNVAKTAGHVGGSVAGAAGVGGSRRKVNTTESAMNESDPELARILEHNGGSETGLSSKDKAGGNKSMLKKTFKNIKKGAKKVDPRRVASAVNSSFMRSQLGTEDAEDAVLASVEKRSKNTAAGEDGFRPAVEGEAPPMKVPSLGNAFVRAVASSNNSGKESNGKTSPSMKMMVQQVMAAQRLERAVKMHKQASTADIGSLGKGRNHRRVRTLLDAIGNEEQEEEPEEAFGGSDFRDFHKVFDADPNSLHEDRLDEIRTSDASGSSGEVDGGDEPNESLPLLGGDSSDGQPPRLSDLQWRAKQLLVKNKFKRVQELLNPVKLLCDFFYWITHSTLLVAIPLFVIAGILFYKCGNPKPPEFLPGSATLSWWFNFVGKCMRLVTLRLNSCPIYLTEFLDCPSTRPTIANL